MATSKIEKSFYQSQWLNKLREDDKMDVFDERHCVWRIATITKIETSNVHQKFLISYDDHDSSSRYCKFCRCYSTKSYSTCGQASINITYKNYRSTLKPLHTMTKYHQINGCECNYFYGNIKCRNCNKKCCWKDECLITIYKSDKLRHLCKDCLILIYNYQQKCNIIQALYCTTLRTNNIKTNIVRFITNYSFDNMINCCNQITFCLNEITIKIPYGFFDHSHQYYQTFSIPNKPMRMCESCYGGTNQWWYRNEVCEVVHDDIRHCVICKIKTGCAKIKCATLHKRIVSIYEPNTLKYYCTKCASYSHCQYLFTLVKLFYDLIFRENQIDINIFRIITNYQLDDLSCNNEINVCSNNLQIIHPNTFINHIEYATDCMIAQKRIIICHACRNDKQEYVRGKCKVFHDVIQDCGNCDAKVVCTKCDGKCICCDSFICCDCHEISLKCNLCKEVICNSCHDKCIYNCRYCNKCIWYKCDKCDITICRECQEYYSKVNRIIITNCGQCRNIGIIGLKVSKKYWNNWYPYPGSSTQYDDNEVFMNCNCIAIDKYHIHKDLCSNKFIDKKWKNNHNNRVTFLNKVWREKKRRKKKRNRKYLKKFICVETNDIRYNG
eukprot:172434_1